MVAVDLIARFASKLETQTSGLAAKIDARTAEFARLRAQMRRDRAALWIPAAPIGAAVMKYVIVG